MKTWRPWGRAVEHSRGGAGLGDGVMLETGELFGGDMLSLSVRKRDQGIDCRPMSICAIRTAAHSAKCTFPGRWQWFVPFQTLNERILMFHLF